MSVDLVRTNLDDLLFLGEAAPAAVKASPHRRAVRLSGRPGNSPVIQMASSFQRGFALTASILAAGAATAGFNLLQASMVSNEIDRRTNTMVPLQAEYRAVVNEISQQTAASETVRDASGFYYQYIRPAPASPGDFVRVFSQVLTAFPHIQLLQLIWAPTADANTTPFYTPSPAPSSGLLQSETKVSTATAGQLLQNALTSVLQTSQPPSELDPLLSDGKFQALIVEAAISPFDGDYRKAIRDINIFLAQINQLPGVTASMIVAPLDVRTTATITATDTVHANNRSDARFVLKLVRSMKAPRQ